MGINEYWKERREEMNPPTWAGGPLLWAIKQRKFLKEEKERKGKVKEKESTLGLRYCELWQRAGVFMKRQEKEEGYGNSDELMYRMS